MINKRRFTYFALLALVVVFLLSGCEINIQPGGYKISGQVTERKWDDQIVPVQEATIYYRINSGSTRFVPAESDGSWELYANRGDSLTIWAQKDNYTFQPAPASVTVTENNSDVDFEVCGWFDDFSVETSRWLNKYYPDGSYQIYNTSIGEYEIKVVDNVDDFISTIAPIAIPSSSYKVKARMNPTGLGSGMIGLIFNVKSFEPGNFYYIFRVRPETKDYELIRADIYENGTQTTLIDGGNSSFFADNGLNILEVRQSWDQVELYVNTERIWSGNNIEGQIIDFSTEGLKAGLYVCADAGTNYTAQFDNFDLTAVGFRELPKFRSLSLGESMTHKDVEITK